MPDSTTPPDFLSNLVARIRTVANSAEKPEIIFSEVVGLTITGYCAFVEKTYLDDEPEKQVFTVRAGPFKGLKMRRSINAGSNFLTMAFGTYEGELHDPVEAAIHKNYSTFVNIGCGDGYYALGFALRSSATKIIGADINPKAQVGLRQNAVLNGLADRVDVRGLFRGEDFASLPENTLVMVDIEGAEDELLDPSKYPALQKLDLIVELHELDKPGVSQRIMDRFQGTHSLTHVPHGPKKLALADRKENVSELDEIFASFEGRGGPTPWVVMLTKR